MGNYFGTFLSAQIWQLPYLVVYVTGLVFALVGILTIEPVGNYAVRIVFDDTHDTGLYVWAYLRELGEHREARWQDYLQDLAAKKLTR